MRWNGFVSDGAAADDGAACSVLDCILRKKGLLVSAGGLVTVEGAGTGGIGGGAGGAVCDSEVASRESSWLVFAVESEGVKCWGPSSSEESSFSSA